MTDYTANAYGVGDSRKGGWKSSAGVVNEISAAGKGQTVKRYVLAAGTEIVCGEIYVNAGTTLAAADTLTITIQNG